MMKSNLPSSANRHHMNQRKPYRRPELIVLGDLRSLTLGGSLGGGDSLVNTKIPYSGKSMPFFDPLTGENVYPEGSPLP